MKVLASTLNHNLPELTDNLVEQLKRSKFVDYELMVVDNGSKEPLAKSTTHVSPENTFFGGGVNLILDYFLNETHHDYLYIFNNDLIFHGHGFLDQSLREVVLAKADVYSPSVINMSLDQCAWKQMHCWGTGGTREVKWIDFQCPLLSRRLCEHIKRYPDELVMGWGLDFLTGMICQELGYKTIVSDSNSIGHLNSQTLKLNKINIGLHDFCQRADAGMFGFFNNNEKYKPMFYEYRHWAQNYTI